MFLDAFSLSSSNLKLFGSVPDNALFKTAVLSRVVALDSVHVRVCKSVCHILPGKVDAGKIMVGGVYDAAV